MEDLKIQIELKDKMIKTLQDSIKLKEDQIATLMDSLSLKDKQLESLQASLEKKDEKIKALEETLEIKKEELKKLSSATIIDDAVLNEKDELIEELNNKIEILNQELEKSDEEIEKLKLANQLLKENKKESASSTSQIINYTHYELSRDDILSYMKKILDQALHKVIITTPTITDLQELYLYEIKSSVSMSISCFIDQSNPDDMELLEEFEHFDNINIRHFEEKDRYMMLKDGEELLLGIIGENNSNILIFHTLDPKHVKTLNSLAIDSWVRSKKIVF
ncbi:MAG: hypothetical protein ACTSU4_14380 [Promethearchaeota archaeon]